MDHPIQEDKKSATAPPSPSRERIAISAAVAALAALYTIAVIAGLIPAECKIDAVNLTLLALAALTVAVLLRPDLLDRLRHFELGALKLELEKIQDAQVKQESELDRLRDIIPLLLSQSEREHLLAVHARTQKSSEASHSFRTELRRLRSASLIRMRKDAAGREHHISDIKDGMKGYFLSDYIELTPLGERWARRIRESEKDNAELLPTNPAVQPVAPKHPSDGG